MKERILAVIGFWFFVAFGLGIVFVSLMKLGKSPEIENGNISQRNFSKNLSVPALSDLPKDKPGIFEHDVSLGSPDAKVTIVEFGNYGCHACGVAVPVIEEVLSSYNDRLRYVWKDYVQEPSELEIHRAAEAARCAADFGKFWEMHDYLLMSQPVFSFEKIIQAASQLKIPIQEFTACVQDGKKADTVDFGAQEGDALSIDSLPYFFINDQRIAGSPTAEYMKQVIDDELAKEGGSL